MEPKKSARLQKDLNGLPGLEEILVRGGDSDSNVTGSSSRNSKNCFYSTVFLILINSTVLPLLLFPKTGLWQKIFYLGLAVT